VLSKLCSVVRLPVGVIAKTVPKLGCARHRTLFRRNSHSWPGSGENGIVDQFFHADRAGRSPI
jgi:hypothetical protein